MASKYGSLGPRPYRAVADTILRLLRIFIPIAIVAAVFIFLIDRSEPIKGPLRITSNIEGAEILIDGVQMGAITDTTLRNIATGRRSVTIYKSSYHVEPEVIFVSVVTDSVVSADFKLISTDTTRILDYDSLVSMESEYEEILLALKETREPERIPTTQSYLEEAKKFIAAEDNEEPITIEQEDISQTQDLTSIEEEEPPSPEIIEGTSILITSTPEDAEIIINGDSTGHRTNRTFQGLSRGSYFISVYKKGYLSNPEEVRIDLSRDFQSEIVAFDLSLDESFPPPKLTIVTEPIEAVIKYNGTPVGKGQVVIEGIYGNSLVEFGEVTGYRTPLSRTLELTPETDSLEIIGTYEALEGKALLGILPQKKRVKGEGLRILVDNELLIENLTEKFEGLLVHKLFVGEHSVKIEYRGMERDTRITLEDDMVSIVTFNIESFLGQRSLRLRTEKPITAENWQKRTRRFKIIDHN